MPSASAALGDFWSTSRGSHERPAKDIGLVAAQDPLMQRTQNNSDLLGPLL
jgi:hypothetical protein